MDCYLQVIDHMKIWFLRWDKTGIHPICSRISTTVWLHHLDSNETPKKLVRNYTKMLCAFILRNLWSCNLRNSSCTTTYLPSGEPSKKDILGTVGEKKEDKWRCPMDSLYGNPRVARPAKIYINQLCVDVMYRLEDLQIAMVDRDGWRD